MSRAGKRAALVLSDGGAKGEFQVGFLRGLLEASPESSPYHFCFFSGVSVGALNASFLAQHGSFREAVTALEAIWDSIQGNSDVYTVPPLLGEKGAIVTALFTESGVARDAIYGSRPLATLIADHVSWPKLEQAAGEGRVWAVGTTSLTDGCSAVRWGCGSDEGGCLPRGLGGGPRGTAHVWKELWYTMGRTTILQTRQL